MIALFATLLAVVTAPYAPVSYACDGSTATFTVNFPYLSNSDLTVTSTTAGGAVTTLSLTTDYTTNVVSTTSTAVLTILVPATKCPSGSTLKIARNTALTQPTGFRAQTVFNPTLHETAFDRTEMQHQELSFKEITDLANVNNTVAAFNSSGAAIGSTTSVLATGDTTPRTLAAWLADSVNVKGKGAKGDGVTDDALALQAASDAAAARNNGKLYLPCGTYMVNSAISLAPTFFGLMIDGENKNCVTIKAGAAMTAVFLYTDASANGRFQFRNVTIDGNALAQYGIKSEQFRYGELVDVVAQGATVAGARFSAGWDITVRNSEFVNNTGDGFVLGDSQGNDLTLDKVLLTSNGGFGARFYGGGPIVVRGGAVQSNLKGGLYFVSLARPAVVDGTYFEANAQNGAAFTTPVKTIKADIISNGINSAQADTNLSFAFPNTNVTVRNCLFNPTFTETAIYSVAASAMNINGNYAASPEPLLKTWGDNAFSKPQNVAISGNVGFSKDWDVDSITTSRSLAFSTWSSDSVTRINYFPRDVFKITKVGVSSGTSVMRRGATKYQGNETYDVDQGAGDTFGVTIDTTVNTELASQLVYVSAWAKASATTAGPRLTIGGKANTASNAVDTAWHHIEFADFAPASGTVTVGFSKLGAVLGDVVTFSRIVVSIVGAPDREFLRDLLPFQWSTTSTPTTGTWAQGDVVWNSAPVAAGVPGWICTAGGTPGTWKTMAAIAP